MTYDVPSLDKASDEFTQIEAVSAGKRCAVAWDPWMGDWFASHSPRNGNSNAEGPWDHWVDLAIGILKDPMTALVRPEAHAAAQRLSTQDFYSESNRQLTEAELADRFGKSA